jgi:dTDP-4-amino-4,6-dideoxygalactose transaminase
MDVMEIRPKQPINASRLEAVVSRERLNLVEDYSYICSLKINQLMSRIQMVDLQGQYLKAKEEIDSAIQSVIENSSYINGPQVKQFTANLASYLNVAHVIPCANGTDALQIALMALGLKPGDEVITVPFTFVATAEVIGLLGLKPVFVDVDPKTFNMDPDALQNVITERTKAIVPVHLFGQCADMNSIMTIANEHGIPVVEDNAQAIGADYKLEDGSTKKAGTIGAIGTTSFYPAKNLGCYGDGGAIFTNDDALAEQINLVANHGSSVKYEYDVIGVNSRLDSIQAAVLDVKLKQLDNYAAARQRAAAYYDDAFAADEQVKPPVRNQDSSHVFHQYTLLVNDRDALSAALREKEIPSMIYYPIPLHLNKAYRAYGYNEGDFPVSEELSKQVLSLPMHTELTTEEQDVVISAVKEFYSVSA